MGAANPARRRRPLPSDERIKTKVQNVSRRGFLRGVTAGGLALAGDSLAQIGRALGAASGQGKQRPNFVFILADDWGWGDLHCHGHGRLRTPNLDRLARRDGLHPVLCRQPVCSPSRTAFLTGQFPAHHRIHGHIADAAQNAKRAMPNFLDPKVPTVTRLLQQAGYATGHFGKWHLGSGPGAPPPGAYGIDTHLTFASNDPEGAKMLGGRDVRPLQSERIVDASLRFIEANRNKPFYVNVWLHDARTHFAERGAAAGVRQADRPGPGVLRGGDGRRQADRPPAGGARRSGACRQHRRRLLHRQRPGGHEHRQRRAQRGGQPGPFRGRKRSIYEGGVRVPFPRALARRRAGGPGGQHEHPRRRRFPTHRVRADGCPRAGRASAGRHGRGPGAPGRLYRAGQAPVLGVALPHFRAHAQQGPDPGPCARASGSC